MIDIAIVTVKQEEFESVLTWFPDSLEQFIPPKNCRRRYSFRQASTETSNPVSIAIVRCVNQGLAEAQNIATDIIEDLDPACILVVGIAGAVPSTDLYLGDVVLGTYVHDFSLGADTIDGRELAIAGYAVTKAIGTLVASLADKKSELGDWYSDLAVRLSRPAPPIFVGEPPIGDDAEWYTTIQKALKASAKRKYSTFIDGPIASSDDLIKAPDKIRERLKADRRILAVEMEAAGIAKACVRHDKQVAFLSIRSISDIVGVPRDPAWTAYACNVAASFTSALINLDLLPRHLGNKIEDEFRGEKPKRVHALVTALRPHLPLEVLADGLELTVDEVQAFVLPPSALLNLEAEKAAFSQSTNCDLETLEFAAELQVEIFRVLLALLAFVESKSSEKTGIVQVRSACSLFKYLDGDRRRQIAPRFFEALDHPMKSLGDKRLVEEAANLCVQAVNQKNKSRIEVDCEARARICGLSWVYQRTGRLELAAIEAKKSLELSKALNDEKNVAYCCKCLGRLFRIQAEHLSEGSERKLHLQKSTESLEDAIRKFSAIESIGSDDPEVGDCYSLLARTFLIAGKNSEAEKCSIEAKKRIFDAASKDYLDLEILLGDIAAKKGFPDIAIQHYTSVAARQPNGNYEHSEIVARSLAQRAVAHAVLGKRNLAKGDYQAAASIWQNFGENEFAAVVEWEAILLEEKLPPTIRKLCAPERARVRVAAYHLLKDKTSLGKGKLLSQRVGHQDEAVWKQLLKRARENFARMKDQ